MSEEGAARGTAFTGDKQLTETRELTPGEILEIRNPNIDTRQLNRHVWALRIVGGVVLVGGWLAISLPDVGSGYFVLDTLVLGALAVYAFMAAAHGRRASVNLEKKIRLSLLVHNVELENLAMRDELTRLFNRRYLFERLERELQATKGTGRPLAVVVIDLDGIQNVNETLGHRIGDKLIAGFGRFLLDQARGSDIPARIGGDEFAIILPDTTDQGAEIVVNRLVQALEKADLIGEDFNVRPSASFGSSGYPWGGDDVDTIMRQANASMRTQKQLHKTPDDGLSEASGTTPIPAVFRKAQETDGALDATPPQ